MVDALGDSGLLGAVDEVIEENAEAAARSRSEGTNDLGQVIGSMEGLDDHPLDPEIGAPDLLDEFGVVQTLDEDPAGLGHPCGHAVDGDRTGCRDGGRFGLLGWRHQDDRLALVRERTPVVAEQVFATLLVAQGDPVGREPHEMTHVAGRAVPEHDASASG